mmetsp:Transcript_68439/g.203599  ORF Transcript_68439/g.203599 Transcript_68439/m.203599 type:complete len:299 (+) Transcript_68439:26-922(+)
MSSRSASLRNVPPMPAFSASATRAMSRYAVGSAATAFFALLGVGLEVPAGRFSGVSVVLPPLAAASCSLASEASAFFCFLVSLLALAAPPFLALLAACFFAFAAAFFLVLAFSSLTFAFLYSLQALVMSLNLAASAWARSMYGAFCSGVSASQVLPAARAISSKVGSAVPSATSFARTSLRLSQSQMEYEPLGFLGPARRLRFFSILFLAASLFAEADILLARLAAFLSLIDAAGMAPSAISLLYCTISSCAFPLYVALLSSSSSFHLAANAVAILAPPQPSPSSFTTWLRISSRNNQ